MRMRAHVLTSGASASGVKAGEEIVLDAAERVELPLRTLRGGRVQGVHRGCERQLVIFGVRGSEGAETLVHQALLQFGVRGVRVLERHRCGRLHVLRRLRLGGEAMHHSLSPQLACLVSAGAGGGHVRRGVDDVRR